MSSLVVLNKRKSDCSKAVHIDRGTIWGNPFKMTSESDREQVINNYIDWLPSRVDVIRSFKLLRGKKLACWCHPKGCHGHVISAVLAHCDDERLERMIAYLESGPGDHKERVVKTAAVIRDWYHALYH